jgi:tetratricopeptide (TPR) repeat protein
MVQHKGVDPSLRIVAIVMFIAVLIVGIGLWAFRPGGGLAADQFRSAADLRPVNRTDQAVWSLQEAVGEAPQRADYYGQLATAFLQKARETGDPTYYEKANQAVQEGLKRDPQDLDSLISKGVLLLGQHRFREALQLGTEAQALYPQVPRIYGIIADAQIELGMYDQAVETIQTMVDLRPDLASYSRVAYARELYGDLAGAIEAMNLAVRSGSTSSEHTEWTRVQLGNLYFATGDLVGAEREYQQSLRRVADYAPALAGLGRIRVAQGQTDAGIALLRQAIERMPLPEYVISLGETLEAAGRSAEAEREYELVRAMQQLFMANGVDADLELALFEADHGDPAKALLLAETAYKRRPGVKAADTLAWALYKNGRFAEAQTHSTEALRIGTTDSQLLFHAGMIAQATGDSTTAQTYLSRALQLNPAFSPLQAREAQRVLSELQGQ